MSNSALDEECLALESIYGESFSRPDSGRIRLRLEAEDAPEVALLLEFVIPDGSSYPDSPPSFDLSNLHNVAFTAAVKAEVQAALQDQAEQQVGELMLYNLAEWARERLAGWAAQSKADTIERAVKEYAEPSTALDDTEGGPAAKGSALKSMTKAQKRRHFDRFGVAEEKPRGWNWVDLVHHLSQRPSAVSHS